MDVSWRRRLGISSRTPRRAAKTTCSDFTRRRSSLSDTLDPDDFADVYGGPPQTVLLRRFSGEFVVSPPSLYDEIFRPQGLASPAVNVGGRSLKAFRIPETTESFYGDIFGSDGDGWSRKAKSMSKSKSNSSTSVLSSEELSPMRTAIDDAALSSFASKLRPINVPTRWNSPLVVPEEAPRKQQQEEMWEFGCPRSSPVVVDVDPQQQLPFRRSSHFSRQVTSPEAVSIEPRSYKMYCDNNNDVEVNNNSPSSAVSSLCQETRDNFFMAAEYEVEEDDDDDDDMSSSYVIEIDSNNNHMNKQEEEEEVSREAIGVDDAIAWAKERFNAHRDSSKNFSSSSTNEEEQNHYAAATNQAERPSYLAQNTVRSQMEMDGDIIRLWSDGKEHNIRLLLSTLDQVLWAKSGWNVVGLTSLKDSTQVKKAYQKARLCLHPDKLQQRGATLEQKHIAQKLFSILQDAWDSFTTNQDVFIR